MTHDLKLDEQYFDYVANGVKTFEIRKNDRNFKVGDILNLNEISHGEFTGREDKSKIVYMITHEKFPDGIKEGYCVLGIKNVKHDTR